MSRELLMCVCVCCVCCLDPGAWMSRCWVAFIHSLLGQVLAVGTIIIPLWEEARLDIAVVFLCWFIVSPGVVRAHFLLLGGFALAGVTLFELSKCVLELGHGQVRSSFLFLSFLFSDWDGLASCDITLHRTARGVLFNKLLCTSCSVFWMWLFVCCCFVSRIDMIRGELYKS